jgi:hypothetical protein
VLRAYARLAPRNSDATAPVIAVLGTNLLQATTDMQRSNLGILAGLTTRYRSRLVAAAVVLRKSGCVNSTKLAGRPIVFAWQGQRERAPHAPVRQRRPHACVWRCRCITTASR